MTIKVPHLSIKARYIISELWSFLPLVTCREGGGVEHCGVWTMLEYLQPSAQQARPAPVNSSNSECKMPQLFRAFADSITTSGSESSVNVNNATGDVTTSPSHQQQQQKALTLTDTHHHVGSMKGEATHRSTSDVIGWQPYGGGGSDADIEDNLHSYEMMHDDDPDGDDVDSCISDEVNDVSGSGGVKGMGDVNSGHRGGSGHQHIKSKRECHCPQLAFEFSLLCIG